MKKKFVGDKKQIEPKFLINPNQHNKVESFFVRLGVIFNDIQSLVWFEKILEDNYEHPSDDDKTDHAGHYAGLKVYLQKIMASTVNEFFDFIANNLDVIDDTDFKNIFSEISKTNQELWNNLVLASTGNFEKVSGLLKSILKTRNNIGFHFDFSGTAIWRAFKSRFFRENKSEKNDAAYYSVTSDFFSTRFYFSDASVEEILYLNAGKKEYEILKGDQMWNVYQNQIKDIIYSMRDTISSLLKIYISKRRNKPK